MQCTASGYLAHDTPELTETGECHADIAVVGPDPCFCPVQKVISDLAVARLGCLAPKAVHDAELSINGDMRFHTKEPVFALLCRLHRGMARIGLFLVENGALTIVAFTSVSERSVMSRSAK